MVSNDNSRSVLVRGFDFGTSGEQITNHMSSAGTIESVQPVDKGMVRITYTSADQAKAAVQLQQTCIAGNSRYIDVITLDPVEFLGQSNIETQRGHQFLAMTPEQQYAVMVRGDLSSARDPTAVLVQRMNQARNEGSQGFNSAQGGNAFNSAGGVGGSLDGELSVLVRGFDFNTSEEQIVGHMSKAGTVQNIQWVDRGSVNITYTFAEEAKLAVQMNQTIIDGNSRYLDVMLMDPQDFLSQHNIDMDKALQFSALTPEQQVAVMAKGSLATARDPNAVLVRRMQEAKNGGKGSFGPAKGSGCGSTGNSPYGGKGGDMQTIMMKQMETMMVTMMEMMAKSSGAQKS